MKYWCIINLSDLHPGFDADILSKRFGPQKFYWDEDSAVEELFRLQQKYPRQEFHLFESVGRVIKSQINRKAWHLERSMA